MYKVLTTFRSAGYSTEGYCNYLHQLSRPGSHNRGRDLGTALAPVHGAPCRARDTLLASILRASGKSAAALLSGKLTDWTGYTARAEKARFKKAEHKHKLSPIATAKDASSLVGKLIGVEVEYYPQSIPKALAADKGLTSVVHDGSIGSNGREVRRVTWVSKNNRLQGLLNIAPVFEGGTVDRRCGLHVHIDARHLPKIGEGTSLVCDAAETYDRIVLFSKYLKKVIPRSRWNNRYCRFVSNRPGSVGFRESTGRYAAINWESYSEHGSIEFRCGSASTNILKIESWALLCRFILNYCAGRENQIPRSWKGFLAILPNWLASWCALRNARLHGGVGPMNDRIASAADFSTAGSTVE